MFPSPLISWAVWANLDRHKDIELILLKGHLLLEIFLTSGLSLRTSLTEPKIKNLSFSAKVRILAETDQQLSKTMEHAMLLNKIRNKLAHEPFPNEIQLELNNWSNQVLSIYSIQKHQKHTNRTKITQAIAALAQNIYELSHRELAASSPPN